MLRVEQQHALGRDRHAGRGDGLAEAVVGAARVHARVLRIGTQNVQRHVVKVEGRPEAVAGADRRAVEQPVDAHRGVADGDQPTLHVDVGAFDRVDVVQRLGEARLLLHEDVLGRRPLVARRVLQHLDLLHSSCDTFEEC